MDNILQKIKKAGLTGRGGGCFPTALKWGMVKNAKGKEKYIICNISEGEPGVLKDKYILDNYMEEAINGVKIAIDFLNAKKAYLYINPKYYSEYCFRLSKIIKDYSIVIFKKKHKAGYIGGEETSAINHIEGKKIEPRLRPPFPTTNGLWNFPTLINNLETFYNVFQIANNKYKAERFYTITGDCLERGVFLFDENMSIAKILKKTNNYPDFDFFVQIGGGASGEILNNNQLNRKVTGSASITVYSKFKHHPIELIREWAIFFQKESCGQCTPCREGLIRLNKALNSNEIDWEMCRDIMDNLIETSFCGLGSSAPIAIKSYIKNVLAKIPKDQQIFSDINNGFICEFFKK